MKKLTIIFALLTSFILFTTSIFAWSPDQACSPAGKNLNPFCKRNIQLTSASIFCNGSSNPSSSAAPNTFKYAAIQGCDLVNGAHQGSMNCSDWKRLSRLIKSDRSGKGCGKQVAACLYYCSHGHNYGDCKDDCINKVQRNCMNDSSFFRSSCPLPR